MKKILREWTLPAKVLFCLVVILNELKGYFKYFAVGFKKIFLMQIQIKIVI